MVPFEFFISIFPLLCFLFLHFSLLFCSFWFIFVSNVSFPSFHENTVLISKDPEPSSVKIFESPHDETNKMACVPSEDSDQPGIHPVWSVFAVHSVGSQGSKVSSCGQQRIWSHWADAQADLSLRWVHRSFCWFCHEVAHIIVHLNINYHFTLIRFTLTWFLCIITFVHI